MPALRRLAPFVTLVVAQPDRPQGRGMKLQSTPIKLAAQELGLPIETPEKSRSTEFIERLIQERADALVVAAYGQILSQTVLDSATRGGINLHGSLLPKYRGAAPIQRAILNGESESGVTLMQMDKGMDTGDIIAVSSTPIDPDETYGHLQERLAELAAALAGEWIERIVAGSYPRSPQDVHLATYAPKIEKAEAELHVQGDARMEYNRFRAFTPAPGAWIQTQAGVLRLSEVSLNPETGDEGTVLSVRDGLTLGFRNGSLVLRQVQPEGKKRMSGKDFANGARLKPGSRLI
jgi:methionyl-tRNA formyltransferase